MRTRRLIQEVKVPREQLHTAYTRIPVPPEQWYRRGPRGGLYEATGRRDVVVGEGPTDFVMNQVTVRIESEGARYIRPHTRRHREAWRALDPDG